MEKVTFKQKMNHVLKRYGYYILFGVLLITILTTLIIVGVSSNSKQKDTPVTTPTSTTITPFMPVLNASIYKEYCGDKLTYNSTLKQWETHNAVDFQVASGSNVYSILDGTVEDVYTNILEGTVVVISHEDGLVSTYGSLGDDVSLKIGDRVSRGDVIGVVSASATSESDAGAHLHFSMTDNGQKIDPASYLNITTK